MKNTKLQIFLTFMKIGAFTLGGGYSMIPMISTEIVDNKKWISEENMSDIIVISESTPGPIAINVATYVGLKTAGFQGAFLATTGVVIPSFLIIIFVASFFQKFMNYPLVQNAFWGVRIAVLALMVKAVVTMLKQCPRNIVSYLVAAVSMVLALCFDVNVLIILAMAAIVGIIYQVFGKTGEK